MTIRRFLPLLTTVLAFWSIFLPFRIEKPWESFSGSIEFINSLNGFDLFLPQFTLPVFLLVALHYLFFEGTKSANALVLFVCGLNVVYMALIYFEIRTESGRFDNPEVGIGFYLLCLAAVTLLVTSIFNYRYPLPHFPEKAEPPYA